MNLAGRLKKIELKMRRDVSGIIHVDGDMNQVEATIERMPTVNIPGLAVLPDGTQKVIRYEPDWHSINVMMSDKDTELTDELRIRNEGTTLIHFISIYNTRMIESEDQEQAHSEIILVDSEANEIEGKILRMPTPEALGEALLSDGSIRPIIYESDWQNINTMTGDADREPELELRIRCGDVGLWVEELKLAYSKAGV